MLPPDTAKANMPRITTGEITDIEYIGSNVYVVGGFTSIQNNTSTNTTTYNQPFLASYNIDTGLVNASFRPTFGGGGVTEIEASPDGTRLFVVGTFNTVNGVTKRKIASINPTTGATNTGFTANANSAASAVDATNNTVYVGGNFTTINGTARVGLAAVNATTGAVVTGIRQRPLRRHRHQRQPERARRHPHPRQQQAPGRAHRALRQRSEPHGCGLDRHHDEPAPPLALVDSGTTTSSSSAASSGSTPAAISPDDSYFVVTSGSGGDRPPISDTAIAFPVNGGDDVQPLWISRAFDSIYSVAIAEDAVFIGGHFQWNESPTAPDPWPGLDERRLRDRSGAVGGYGLGDAVVRRDHIGALDPATGKALEWDPGSNSYEGNKAMLVTPRGVFAGGDGNTQGGANGGRVAFYDFNTVPGHRARTRPRSPIRSRGASSRPSQEFVVDGTATATSGVQRVQLEVRDREHGPVPPGQPHDLGRRRTRSTRTSRRRTRRPRRGRCRSPSPATGSCSSSPRTFGVNGSSDATKATKKIETFGLTDQTPTTGISGPNGSIIPTLTFTITGTAQDDVGVNSISIQVLDQANRYLQDDGTVSATTTRSASCRTSSARRTPRGRSR